MTITGLGWTFVIVGVIGGVYVFAWALCMAAAIGDRALDNLDDDAAFEDRP